MMVTKTLMLCAGVPAVLGSDEVVIGTFFNLFVKFKIRIFA